MRIVGFGRIRRLAKLAIFLPAPLPSGPSYAAPVSPSLRSSVTRSPRRSATTACGRKREHGVDAARRALELGDRVVACAP
jgi:hypothetical protein